MIQHSRGRADIVVVDAQLDDYHTFIQESDCNCVLTQCYTAGEVALQNASATARTLWIVNTRIPDMTGIHFLQLIRRRLRRCSVFLVGDTYSADDEFAARLAGATAYVCKPVDFAWLQAHVPRCRSPAIRAGPPRVHSPEPA